MTTDTTVRARIDGHVKDEAAHVLADMGLTVSDAIRLMLMRVAAEKALPFPVKVRTPRPAPPCARPDRARESGSQA